MFDRIFDFFADIYESLIPCAVIDEYEAAVVLRFGKYHRTIGPGLRWIIPFGVEEVMKDTVVRTTSYLSQQSLTTLDGHPVVSSPIIVYKIGNIKRWLLEVDDAEDALHDMTYGLNEELTMKSNLEDVFQPEFAERLTEAVKEAGVSWGARVEAVKFSDRAKCKSIRLWTGSE